MTNSNVSKKTSNSLLYLALLCLLIFHPQSSYPYLFPRDKGIADSPGGIYVEIDDGRSSVVRAVVRPEDIDEIRHIYNIDDELKNGDKVIIKGGEKARTVRISGIKSIPLGVPIGINSATAEDLEALPGIGEKLALRIVSYRNENGRYKHMDALLEVNGMGKKKLSRIKPYTNLD
ncbi:MAG: ComEA family DNA-binding protein [Thermodesulfobacteriota bacterium]